MNPRVVFAYGYRLILEGLVALVNAPEIEVVGMASTGKEAFVLVRKHRPNVLLIDLDVSGVNSLITTRAVRRQMPRVKVMILASLPDRDKVATVLKAGAWGCVLKAISTNEFVEVLKACHQGRAFISEYLIRDIEGRDLDKWQDFSQTDLLSGQERKVLKLIGKGLNNKAIANKADISPETVKIHLKHIYRKLNIKNRTQAAIIAIEQGFIQW